MLTILQDWLSLFFRWAHIVAAMGWIGTSFYFMALDASLKRREAMSPDIKGENWSVHGGGFYHIQKYMVAPAHMPDELHWYRWEAYMTWLTGFALLTVIYYWGARSYMIDPSVAALAPWQAVALSLLGLAGSWLFYDALCKSRLKNQPTVMFAVLFAGILVATVIYGLMFAPRAAFLQIGAMLATMMAGNVFLVIIPNQRIIVADLKAGRTPDPEFGRIGKLRSTHNNYLTLPVIFLMISNHYPMTFGAAGNWVVVGFALLIGVFVRHWFNRYEAGATGGALMWQWPAAAGAALALSLYASLPAALARVPANATAGAVTTPEAVAIVERRCTACHSAHPTQPGFLAPPAGVVLTSADAILQHADKVFALAVQTHTMPLGNITHMTDQERAELGAWLESRRAGTD